MPFLNDVFVDFLSLVDSGTWKIIVMVLNGFWIWYSAYCRMYSWISAIHVCAFCIIRHRKANSNILKDYW